jgi:hypothetical protein
LTKKGTAAEEDFFYFIKDIPVELRGSMFANIAFRSVAQS